VGKEVDWTRVARLLKVILKAYAYVGKMMILGVEHGSLRGVDWSWIGPEICSG